MRLYLIRHGQSVNNLLWTNNNSEKGRSHDPELTPIGHKQAQCVAEFLRNDLGARLPLMGMYQDDARPKILYTSLMTRAVETGHVIAQTLNIPLVALEEAFEAGGLYLEDEATGERRAMAGPNREHFIKHFPLLALPDAVGEQGWYNRPAEPMGGLPERSLAVWNELMKRHKDTDDVIALLTHGGFYNHLLKNLMALPARDTIWFTYNNCAVSRIDVTPRGMSFTYLNRFDFLPPELVTL